MNRRVHNFRLYLDEKIEPGVHTDVLIKSAWSQKNLRPLLL